jgi:hypothetical protein
VQQIGRASPRIPRLTDETCRVIVLRILEDSLCELHISLAPASCSG